MALSDLIRQIAFYESGGKPEGHRDVDKANKLVGSIRGQQENFRKVATDALAMEANKAKFQEAKRKLMPASQVTDPTIDEAQGLATIDATEALSRMRSQGKDVLYINPTTREISMTPQDGFYRVSNNTGATIAAGPAKEASIGERQGENQRRAAEIKEASENRTKRKSDLEVISDVEGSYKAYMDTLGNVPAGLAGGAQTLASKTGLGFSDAATADRTRNAIAVSMYRALTGDTRLSDADAAARAVPLLPSGGQDAGQRQKLDSFINARLQERKQRLINGVAGEMPLPDVGQIIRGDAQTGSPRPGDIDGGYRFIGGNPGDPSSWERVQ